MIESQVTGARARENHERPAILIINVALIDVDADFLTGEMNYRRTLVLGEKSV